MNCIMALWRPLCSVASRSPFSTPDGLCSWHCPQGNRFLYEQLQALMGQKCPHLLERNMKMHLPHWSECADFDWSTVVPQP